MLVIIRFVDHEEGGAVSTAQSKQSHGDGSLWTIINPVKGQVYTGMVMSAVSGVAWIMGVVLLRPVAARMLEGEVAASDLWRLGALILLFIAVAIVLRILSFAWSHRGAFALEEILRTKLTTHLSKVPLGFVMNAGSGAIKKVLMDDVLSLHAFVADSTPLLARAVATPLIALVTMFVVDWRMALVSLAVFPIGMIATQFAFRDYATGREEMESASERMNSAIVEYVQGMQVVRTFDDGTSSFRRYSVALNEASDTMKKWSDKSKYGAYIAGTLFSALPTLAIIGIVGSAWLQAGTLDLPTFLLFVLIAPTLPDSIIPLVYMTTLINLSRAGAKRIETMLAQPILPEALTPVQPRDGSVEFSKASFTYPGRTEPALQDVSLFVPEGSVTALVGLSGAGKSTVARLIPRFWDADAGEILVGGVNVKDIRADDLMRHVSFVFQVPFLLHESIRENIRLGKPDATDEEVEQAAQAAQAHEFIVNELPNGYETVAGERGTRLSGGQRQRITIARAILQNSPVIVLDEATAFADPENEAKIHAGIAHLTRGKTLIVVAHRLSTIKDADNIVVLDQGGVAEQGVHNDLVSSGGVYARLWDRFTQAQGWGLRKTGTPAPEATR